MPRCQGRYLSEYEIRRITDLLENTDLSMVTIAERMSCTRGSVARINRQHNVRSYDGRRTEWSLAIEGAGK